MPRPRSIWILCPLAAAVCVGAAMGVHASAAAPIRAGTGTATIDKTYSCRVRAQHFVDLYAGVNVPASPNQAAATGFLVLTTGVRSRVQNGVQTTVSQASVSAKKDSLRIDTKSCQRVERQVPLKPTGLPSPPTLVTSTMFGHDSERCGSTARVLFRLRVKTVNHVPTQALFAVRDDSAKSKPIAFYKWSADKVSAYPGKTCVSS